MLIECKQQLSKIFENITDIELATTLSLVVESQLRNDNVSKDIRLKFINDITENTDL
jgi:hypothetical protein